jgi:hypothetical protein
MVVVVVVVVARGKHGNIQELWHTGTEQESVLRDWAGRMGKWDGRQPDRGPLILSL